jgi:hypothetical protein
MFLVAAAAAAVVVVGAAIWLARGSGKPGWEVVRLEGAPRVASTRITAQARLPVGGWLETDAVSRAAIRIGGIGEVHVEPGTRVQLVRAEMTDHRLALARGTLRARIWAPPRLFSVETPSATAVDLGCTYTLTVDAAGGSLLHVTTGWVAFDSDRRESFVPAGALCATRPGVGPGTPYFEDGSPAFRDALAGLDFEGDDAGARGRWLEVVLVEARPRDALSLWHLLSTLAGEERGRVYDRLAELVPPPRSVTRAGVLRGDREMIDAWWDELGLGVTTWWRLWKGSRAPG